MFTEEQKIRAIELYFKYGKKLAPVVRELGYPSKRNLRRWIRSWEAGGGVKESIRHKPRYTDEQKQVAVEHYLNHGCCLAFTSRALGYPCTDVLARWVNERYPDRRRIFTSKANPVAPFEPEVKRQAVMALCTRQVSASEIDQVVEWQNRPLDAIYPIVYLDCIVLKVRQDSRVINKAVFLALGINLDGQKELLGMWLAENEGAKFWLNVLTELKNRGLNDILIACVDGLKGFPEAINAVYPETQIQLCIVHMVRNSLRFVAWKDYKAVTRDLKQVYRAATEEGALQALDAFGKEWDARYPQISRSWRANWSNIATFFVYPEAIRKVIYITNAIESLNSVIRHAIKKRKVFPTDESLKKVVWLAIQSASQKWTMPLQDWRIAMSRFIIEFGDRLDGHF
ncbi:IS256 family transposase [Escherichia coli]|nr:IS256 family transposase [Escherichia coli]EFM2127919.1 IS256 family transposase [Escherichia coli]EFM2146603.1 IS256 family transposase [Escherichia coli]EFM2159616.1 IS256 family transposase [Escherichia coli]EFM2168273.1 IS256 family transposase [Escherichia coli]